MRTFSKKGDNIERKRIQIKAENLKNEDSLGKKNNLNLKDATIEKIIFRNSGDNKIVSEEEKKWRITRITEDNPDEILLMCQSHKELCYWCDYSQ